MFLHCMTDQQTDRQCDLMSCMYTAKKHNFGPSKSGWELTVFLHKHICLSICLIMYHSVSIYILSFRFIIFSYTIVFSSFHLSSEIDHLGARPARPNRPLGKTGLDRSYFDISYHRIKFVLMVLILEKKDYTLFRISCQIW